MIEYGGTTFNANAYCVNVGTRQNPIWHPADHLNIVPNQVVKHKLDDFSEDMVRIAEKRPARNELHILNFARSHLGISPQLAMFNVSRRLKSARKSG